MEARLQTEGPSPAGGMEEILGKIREAIWRRRPILGEIMQRHGGKVLYDYAQDFLDVNKSPLLDARKPELIGVAEALIAERLGPSEAKRIADLLTRIPLVSTADHHATIDHPFWVNANLITALPMLAHPELDMHTLVVFSFAGVSLNNASGYPRGIQFYGGTNGSKNVQRLPILLDKHKMSVVYATRAFTRDDLERARQELHKRVKAGIVTQIRADAVEMMVDRYFAADDVLALPDLSSQITKINHALWPKFFHGAKGAEERKQVVPNLLYLEIETLVTRLMLEKHLADKASLVHRALFDPAFRPLILKHFNGIPGAFSIEKDWGTYFFWYVDDKGHRVRLYLKGDHLESKLGMHKVPCTPEGIAEALRRKEIFPSMLMCYLLVSLYYGMKCLGGFCQVNDLTMTKKAWEAILREAGEGKEADALEPVQTKELGGDGLVLTYTRTVDGDLIPGSGPDMFMSPAETGVEKYVERSKWVTLSEMMNPMLPEMYTVLYPSTERDPSFTVTPEAILKATGLGEKLDRNSR